MATEDFGQSRFSWLRREVGVAIAIASKGARTLEDQFNARIYETHLLISFRWEETTGNASRAGGFCTIDFRSVSFPHVRILKLPRLYFPPLKLIIFNEVMCSL